MSDEQQRNGLCHFDRLLASLDGLPDVVQTRPTVMRVIPPFGLGVHLYSVQTFRQRDAGDTVFLEYVSENGTTRIVLPPPVVDAIVRQRDQVTAKVRSRAGKLRAEEMKRLGIKPGFMKGKK